MPRVRGARDAGSTGSTRRRAHASRCSARSRSGSTTRASRLRRGVVLILDYAAELDELVERDAASGCAPTGPTSGAAIRSRTRGAGHHHRRAPPDVAAGRAPGRVHDRAASRARPTGCAALGIDELVEEGGRAGKPARRVATSRRSPAGAGSPRPPRSPIPPASAPTPSSSSPSASDGRPACVVSDSGRAEPSTPSRADEGELHGRCDARGAAGGGTDVPAARGLRARHARHRLVAPRHRRRRSRGVLGRGRRASCSTGRALGHGARVGPAVREVVRRRPAERVVQLRRPPRRGRARRPGRVPLGGRARRRPHDHLRRSSSTT